MHCPTFAGMKESPVKEINTYDALKLMRKLSKDNFPVTFSFVSCDRSRRTSSGLVTVEKALLSAGLPSKKSVHAKNLIAFENLETGEKKHFWLPLLMTLNGLKITHDRISR